MPNPYFVYILASQRNGTLYVGVTNDLSRRVMEHKDGLVPGFTAKHGVKMPVWYQPFDLIDDAIAHEKRLKRWARRWKLEPIEKVNPRWDDLYETTALP